MRYVILAGVLAVLFGPATLLTGYAVWSQYACAPQGDIALGEVPDGLSARTSDGTVVELEATQMGHAATIVAVGARTDGVGRDGVIVAVMAALTESRLRMLANATAYPDSASYPHDGDGSDHDSLGLFQMRPAAGWGTVAQLMNPEYQARAFFGGTTGPNHGSPRGLLDIPDWQALPKGVAAQAVEVSAFPDRYATFEPVAETVVDALTAKPEPVGGPDTSVSDGPSGWLTVAAEGDEARDPSARRAKPARGGNGQAARHGAAAAEQVVFPLPEGTGTRTSGFGYRVHPVTGEHALHAGVDYAAPEGTPVLALAAGVVTYAGPDPLAGNLLVIEHTIDGELIASAYAHLVDGTIRVSAGDRVVAGQHVAAVGSTGRSTGPHLHLELRPGGFDRPAIDPEPWLQTHRAAHLDQAAVGSHPTCRFLSDLSE
ncbi:hypothetical protein GCM10028784_29990 [Myceligenerans cantabricum]